MAHIIDNENHNSYYDGMTLSNCTYTVVGEGCTGTISNSDYVEIGTDNTNLSITNSDYVVMGDNNTDITIQYGKYIIVGNHNTALLIGGQQDTERFVENPTGANSVSVVADTVGLDITGDCEKVHKTRYAEVDGYFNNIEECGSLVINQGNGNNVESSRVVEIIDTNNNYVYADNLNLDSKDSFLKYNKLKDVIKVAQMIPPIERQSDSVGTVLNTMTNTLNTSDAKSDIKYTIIDGYWTETK